MNRTSALLALVLAGVLTASQGQAQTRWDIGSGHNYRVDGSGDVAGASGATVTLRSGDAEPEAFGASAASLDATAYRGHTIALSADLDTRDAKQGAGIWLRADGAQGRLAFANSQAMPVVGTVSAAHREVQIDVPQSATRLLLGTLLMGNGEVVAHKLHLDIVASVAPAVEVAPDVVLDAAIRTVRERALHTRRIDWSRVEPEIRALAKDAKTSKDVYPAIQLLLAKLDDRHSSLMEPQASRQFSQGGASNPAPVVELKPHDIGYIDMPAYFGVEAKAQEAAVAKTVEAVSQIAPRARCGWIVDLRRDGGGNMYPMLESLRPLLGTQPLGSFRDAYGARSEFSAVGATATSLLVGPDLQSVPVAVLTGPQTASSGEVVAVAFRGRPNTRSFGAATAGLSTANAMFPLPDGSTLVLTTGVDLDRDGHAYGGKIEPDVTIAQSTQGSQDATFTAATDWLTHSPACRR
jgi:C-terminal processing protease CtpA/Prc